MPEEKTHTFVQPFIFCYLYLLHIHLRMLLHQQCLDIHTQQLCRKLSFVRFLVCFHTSLIVH